MNKWVEIGLWSTATALASGFATFLATKKHLDKVYSERVQDEVADIKAHYQKIIDRDKASMRNEAQKEVMGQLLDQLGYSSEEELEKEIKELESDEPEEAPVLKNVFDTIQLTPEELENGVGIDPEDEDDVEEGYAYPRGEIVKEPDYPFTITREEYFEDEADYDKITITYYESDDILADDRDEPIDDIEGAIGPDALESFGHISEDPNICYVRNRSREADFEIIKNEGSYSVIVHGMDPEDLGLKPAKKRPKKMRDDG